MMAAAQPFISGAISKTINLPNSASVDDIKNAYQLSWKLGLKANALYRDGCKLSQPLNTRADADDGVEDEEGIEQGKQEVASEVAAIAGQIAGVATSDKQLAVAGTVQTVERTVEKIVERPLRRRLPDTRRSVTHKFNVAGHEGYLTVGLYQDGTPGELFITMAKEGSTIGGLMDSLGTAVSVALQYGVPVESLVTKFTHQRFEPAGMTHNADIPFAKSLVDYIFRWMGMEFVPGYRAANAPIRPGKSTEDPGKATDRTASDQSTSDQKELDQNRHDPNERTNPSIASLLGRQTVPSHEATGPSRASERGEGVVQTHTYAAATLTTAMVQVQADAPACDVCGTITVRNGTCYKCLNCGNSMGCS